MSSITIMDELHALSKEMEAKAVEFRRTMHEAAKAWPDFAMVKGVEWQSREITPPDGPIWASDGLRVWLIHGSGEPIPKTATAVKFWTAALIPAPPLDASKAA